MSKKSRKRNKKILAAIGIGLGAAALASKRRKDATADVDSGRGGDSASATARADANKKTDYITKKDTSKKDTSKSDVNVDTKPKTVVNRSRNKVIYSDGTSETPGTIYQKNKIKNEVPNTPPPSIDNPYSTRVIKGGRRFKDGGRTGLKSGGKVKGCGIAKRGFGKAMKGNR